MKRGCLISFLVLLALLVSNELIRTARISSAGPTSLMLLSEDEAPLQQVGEPPLQDWRLHTLAPFEELASQTGGPPFGSGSNADEIAAWIPKIASELEFVGLMPGSFWRERKEYFQPVRVRDPSQGDHEVPALLIAWISNGEWRASLVWWQTSSPNRWHIEILAGVQQRGWLDQLIFPGGYLHVSARLVETKD